MNVSVLKRLLLFGFWYLVNSLNVGFSTYDFNQDRPVSGGVMAL
jgi:hypothetical protein